MWMQFNVMSRTLNGGSLPDEGLGNFKNGLIFIKNVMTINSIIINFTISHIKSRK